MNTGAIADSTLNKVAFDGKKKQIVGLDLALWRILIAEHLYSTVDFGAEEQSLCLGVCQHYISCGFSIELTSGVPMYFLVS